MVQSLAGVTLCQLGFDILAGCTVENLEQVKKEWLPAWRSGAESARAFSTVAAERGAAIANFSQLKESEGAAALALASYNTLRGRGVPFTQSLTLASHQASTQSAAAAAAATSQGKRPRDNGDNTEGGRDRGSKNTSGSKGNEKRN